MDGWCVGTGMHGADEGSGMQCWGVAWSERGRGGWGIPSAAVWGLSPKPPGGGDDSPSVSPPPVTRSDAKAPSARPENEGAN